MIEKVTNLADIIFIAYIFPLSITLNEIESIVENTAFVVL